MAERFLLRTEGGPCAGETRVVNTQGEGWEWPMPDVLEFGEQGRYVKVTESELPPQEEGSGVLRGATYEWEAAGG